MIEVRGLTKEYGSKKALDDVSFSVPKGQVLGLLGLNGAGKSTTMNIIAGCLAPTAGTVLIDGIDIAKQPAAAKRKIGYLPELPPLYMDMKVGDFLAFVCELKKLRGDRKADISAVCEKTGIDHVRGRLIKNLSKGYRQRVGLASAMLGDPEVLILDEPTVGLDPTQIIEVRTLIGEIGAEKTVILSSHILSEIQAVCERVLVLNEGRIVADGKPEAMERDMQRSGAQYLLIEGEPELVQAVLKALPGLASVRRGEEREPGVWEWFVEGQDGADLRRELFAACSAAGAPILGMRSGSVTLEDVFLSLIGRDQTPVKEYAE